MQITAVASAADAPAVAADMVLLPGRAAFLPATATLLVADLHLGKAATFRSHGIPVPEGSAQKDLTRLAMLVAATAARRLIVLGDLFHARSGCTGEVFAEFIAARSRFADTEVLLVAGNHDRSVGRLPPGLGIDSLLRTHDEPPSTSSTSRARLCRSPAATSRSRSPAISIPRSPSPRPPVTGSSTVASWPSPAWS